VYAVKTPVGLFKIDAKGGLTEFIPYASDETAVHELSENWGDWTDEKGYRVFWENRDEILRHARVDLQDYLKTGKRLAHLLAESLASRSKDPDEIIIQGVEVLEDFNRALNILGSRLLSVCSTLGVDPLVEDEAIDYQKILEVGREIPSYPVSLLSEEIESLFEQKEALLKEIKSQMTRLSPNLSGLIGPVLGANLIKLAGSLEALARMPGSRIQILGAEKALFRHLKERARPPKHGIIFQHPTVALSPWWQRGKISRALSGKIAIAARLDVFSEKDQSKELKEDFMKSFERIKKNFPSEPKKMRIIRAPRPAKKRRKRR
jgi:RNA processing factor Prp31